MTIFLNQKQQILLKSLKKQLHLIIHNLQQFGISDSEIHHFIIEAILQTGEGRKGNSLSQLQDFSNKKDEKAVQNQENTKLVDRIVSQIQSQLPSVKTLLKYIANSYAQNHTLTSEESFITFAQNKPTLTISNETSNPKLLASRKSITKVQTKNNQSIKTNYEDSMHRRKSLLFDQEFLFERKTSFERAQENYDEYEQQDDQAEDPFTNNVTIMQREIARLKEMQKLYQQELNSKINEKRNLLQKLDSSFTSQRTSLNRGTLIKQII